MSDKFNKVGIDRKHKVDPPQQTYFDVDRAGCCYLLKVKFSFNKKGELVETIMKVTHLGKLSHLDYVLEYSSYVVWSRAFESNDIKQLGVN